MQKRQDHSDILMYSTNNSGKSVIAGRFIRTLEAKIYNKMTANDSKSFLLYKLVDQYDNNKVYYSALTEKIRRIM